MERYGSQHVEPVDAFSTAVETLRHQVRGPVVLPGDGTYDAERGGFQTWRQHRPDVVVGVTDTADVQAAVTFAAAQGLAVAVQATGHGMPRPAEGGVLLNTRRMSDSRVDAEAGSAWIEAGVRWEQVIEQAAPHGLAPLSGSAPSVGAVSYTLGGGAGLVSRRYGYAADYVRTIDVVTADARLLRVTSDNDPGLFWALRGGRANFGVVTGMEVGLVPLTRLYGGGMFFDASHVEDVLCRWRQWTATVPEEMTSSVALIPFPHSPTLPEPLRGRHVAHVRIAYTGTVTDGEALVEPLRAVGPRLLDTLGELPYTASASIYQDPTSPMAYYGTTTLLRDLDEHTLHDLLELVGPGAPEPCVVEIRHLGGALSRQPTEGNAVGNRDARYLAGAVSSVESTDVETVHTKHQLFEDVVKPCSTGGRTLNFLIGACATPDEVRAAYDSDDYERLRDLKTVYDPTNLFRLNHNIPPRRGTEKHGV